MAKIKVDLNRFTLGELEEIEERTGLTIGEIGQRASGQGGGPPARLLRALAYVAMRRDDPATTWEATADLAVDDFVGVDEVDPHEPGD